MIKESLKVLGNLRHFAWGAYKSTNIEAFAIIENDLKEIFNNLSNLKIGDLITIMDTDCSELYFSQRVMTCFQVENIKKVGDLVEYSYRDLLKVPHLGQKSVDEIVVILKENGLELKKG